MNQSTNNIHSTPNIRTNHIHRPVAYNRWMARLKESQSSILQQEIHQNDWVTFGAIQQANITLT